MEFRVLGPIELLGDDGTRVSPTSDRQRRLLGFLALHAGRPVDADALGDALDLSAGAVRTAVSRLRRVVGFDVLVTAPPGYELRTDRVDAIAFERSLGVARRADTSERVVVLGGALDLWRGTAYAEFAHEPWAMAEVARLAELRRNAVELLAEAEIRAGDAGPAIARLEALIAEHPFADRPRALLMEALADTGRRPEALRAFVEYRRVLAEEVGTEPGPDLVELDRRIAVGPDPSSVRRLEPRSLPARWTSLVGRADEIGVVAEMVGSNRLTTLTGAGGCGKTSLALEVVRGVAETQEVPVVWVELASARNGDDVLDHLMAACGVRPVPGGYRLASVARHLGQDSPVVLVLDNAEHVREAVVDDVIPLLRTCGRLHVLVTSRVPLGVIGEVVRRVPSLSTPPTTARSEADLLESGAGALIVERVRSIRHDLVLDADSVKALVDVCRRVEGLPLALELAAGRMRTRSPARVAAELREGSHSSVASRVSDRHATMRSSIAWSVDLLGPTERTALSRLAAFAGSFSERDVVAVLSEDDRSGDALTDSPLTDSPLSDSALADRGSDGRAPLDVLSRLVDANLVSLEPATGRFRLSEATRQYLRVSSTAFDDPGGSDARHARRIADWCLEVGAGRHGIERRVFLERMPEVVAANTWGRDHDPTVSFDICCGLASMRLLLGYPDDLERTWRWLMAHDRSSPTAARWASATAALLAAAANAGWDPGGVVAEVAALLPADDAQGRRWVERIAAMRPAVGGDVRDAMAHARSVVTAGDDLEMSIYVGFAAYMAAMCGLLSDADELIDAVRQMLRRQDLPFRVDTVGNVHGAAVVASIAKGDRSALAGLLDGPAPADSTFSATSSSMLAHAAVLFGSDRLLARSLSWASTETVAGLRFLRPLDRFHQAMAAGQAVHAANLAEEYDDAAGALPVSRFHPRALLNVPLLETGAVTSVRRSIDEGERLVAGMPGAPYLNAQLLLSRSQLALVLGDVDGARRAAEAAAEVAAQRGFTLVSIDAAELVAVAAHLDGASAGDVARLLAEPLGRRAAIGYRAVLVPRERYDAALGAAGRSALGPRTAA